jgi:hypothetical protein
MSDKNYMSWDGGGDDPPNTDVIVDPIAAGWAKGSWQDSAKFHKRQGMIFKRIIVVDGGTEDAVDANNGCNDNAFIDFTVSAGDVRVLTLKGGSSRNYFSHWVVIRHGPVVDIEIGDWSSFNLSRSRDNHFHNWQADDNGPITYAYRVGCAPIFTSTYTKHLWWRSIGLTFYWWFKYVKHVIFKMHDNMGK